MNTTISNKAIYFTHYLKSENHGRNILPSSMWGSNITFSLSSPPFCVPSIGIHIERMFSQMISSFNLANPSSKYSILEGCLYEFLVRKLMIVFPHSLKVVISPIRTNCFEQSCLYFLNISGNLNLNSRAIPFPMNLSQFTVLTICSQLSLKIDPLKMETILKNIWII